MLEPQNAWSPREKLLDSAHPRPPSKPRPENSKLNEKRQGFAIGAKIASTGKSRSCKVPSDNRYEWGNTKVLDHPTLAWSSGGRPKSGRKSKSTTGLSTDRQTPNPSLTKTFICPDCDKMYTSQKDLDIHKSFCYSRL